MGVDTTHPEPDTAGEREISPDGARVRVLVIPTDEERVAAQAVRGWRKDHRR